MEREEEVDGKLQEVNDPYSLEGGPVDALIAEEKEIDGPVERTSTLLPEHPVKCSVQDGIRPPTNPRGW